MYGVQYWLVLSLARSHNKIQRSFLELHEIIFSDNAFIVVYWGRTGYVLDIANGFLQQDTTCTVGLPIASFLAMSAPDKGVLLG